MRYNLQRPVIYGNLQKCAGTSSCRGGNPLWPVFFVPVSHFPGKEQQRHGRKEEYFICTADPKYFKTGQNRSTSAASALSWACKWIVLCEMWLNGEIPDDVAQEGNY